MGSGASTSAASTAPSAPSDSLEFEGENIAVIGKKLVFVSFFENDVVLNALVFKHLPSYKRAQKSAPALLFDVPAYLPAWTSAERRAYKRYKTPKPMFDVRDTSILFAYFEMYDPKKDQTIVLLGENHTIVPVAGTRAFRDEAFDLMNNGVLKGLMKDPRPKELKTLLIERDLQAEMFVGGGPFDIDEDTGAVRFDPSFEPETALGLPKIEYVHRFVLDYLESTARRIGLDVKRVDTRELFVEHLIQEAWIFAPGSFLRNHSEMMVGFQETNAKARQHYIALVFCTVCKTISDNINGDLGERLIGGVESLRPYLEYLRREFRSRKEFGEANIDPFVVLTLKDYKPFRFKLYPKQPDLIDIDAWTFKFVQETQSLFAQIMDIFTLRRIFEDETRGRLIVLYAGASHTNNIARYLLSNTAPSSYVLRHVGQNIPTGSDRTKLNVTTNSQLLSMYNYSQTQDYKMSKNLCDYNNSPYFPDFTYDSNTLLFGDMTFTSEIIQAMKDQARSTMSGFEELDE